MAARAEEHIVAETCRRLADDIQRAGRGHGHFDHAHAAPLNGFGGGDQLFG